MEKKAIPGFPIAAAVYALPLAKVIWIGLFYTIGVVYFVVMLSNLKI